MYEEDDDFEGDISGELSEEEETDIIEDLEEEDEEGNNFKIMTYKNVLENILKTPKKTIPIMTKFEKARIFGIRLQQIANGAKALIDVSKLKGTHRTIEEEIVDEELKQRKTPLIIRRILPNGVIEDWKMEDFELIQ